MQALLARSKQFLSETDGPTATEYAVMLALIIVVALTAISSSLGSSIMASHRMVRSDRIHTPQDQPDVRDGSRAQACATTEKPSFLDGSQCRLQSPMVNEVSWEPPTRWSEHGPPADIPKLPGDTKWPRHELAGTRCWRGFRARRLARPAHG